LTTELFYGMKSHTEDNNGKTSIRQKIFEIKTGATALGFIVG